LSHQTNGTSLSTRPSQQDLSRRRNEGFPSDQRPQNAADAGLRQPARLNVLGRKDSDISKAASESDSLLDLYGNTTPSRSVVGAMGHEERSGANGTGYDLDDPENSRWIHRDKLARIESREMQEAGIHIGRDGRSASRQQNKRSRSKDFQSNGVSDSHHGEYGQAIEDDQQRRRVASPVIMDEDEEPMNFDLRLPEESAADAHGEERFYRTPTAKQSYSRIPLSTSSPIPVPQDYIARPTPLARSGSNGWSGDDEGFSYNKARSRSQSVGSQVLLDDEEHTPTSSSPSKGKLASKAGARKTSATRPAGPQKSRSRSNHTRTESRPGTRSGETPPGSSSKRPEGDPPWLAHMYKPDPRLPPDQQLLPTIAKRMKQEQWEREGKVGSVYDREFNTLELHDETLPSSADNAIKTQTIEMPEKNMEEGLTPDWPLQGPRSPSAFDRPGTSGTDHGGYKTMPTIQTAPPNGPASNFKPQQPIRVEEPMIEAADDGRKKGCGCCIVM
jgi:hypothetical protein